MMVIKINLLHRSYGRLAQGGEGARGLDMPLYFYQVQDYQPRKKHEVESKSYLQKLLNGLHRFNLF